MSRRRLWYVEPDAISNAVGYAKFFSRSHDAVIRVCEEAGNVIETHEEAGEFKASIKESLLATHRDGVKMRQLTSPCCLSCDDFVNFQAARLFISPSVSHNRGDTSFFFR